MELLPLPTGMFVLLGIAVVAAVAAHWRLRRYWLACLVGAVATLAVFFVACLVQAGMPEPLEPLALAYFGGFGFVVALLLGGPGPVRLAKRSVPVRA